MLPMLPPRPDLSLPAILIYAVFTFAICLTTTPAFVAFLKKYKLGKKLRMVAIDGGDASIFLTHHSAKAGTPTMGGLLIWGSILFVILFSRLLSLVGVIDYSLLQRREVYLPLFALVSLGVLGALDDYLNIAGIGKKKGLDALPKLATLLLIGGFLAWWFFFNLDRTAIHIPFGEFFNLPGGLLELGWIYMVFFLFVFVATANAVNFTDGLDGLASGLLIVAYGSFGIIAYMKGLFVLSAFCGVTVGALAAFLWHNIPPALFFMGDTGSLAMGGTLAVIAFMVDEVLILPLVGSMFVVELLSVVIQLTSKKLWGRKVFKSAPIHHHFEALGWGESKVTMRFWIVGMITAFFGILAVLYG